MEFPVLESWVRWLTFAPLFACSIVGMAITIQKWLEYRRPPLPRNLALHAWRERFQAGDLERAAREAEADESLGGRLLAVAIRSAGRPRQLLKEHLELAGGAAAADVEHGLGGLALLAALGPLFGLLGTVVGIVLVFNRLAATGGVASPAELAGGIGTALFTTIAGITVGILALIVHRYLSARADRIIGELESFALVAIDLVKGNEA
jgi:biopolymer transport protein ExbB